MIADLVVVGGGLVGCALARDAAGAGLRVVVLERGTPGGEASGAAAGMLSPLAGSTEPGEFTDFLLRCAEYYPGFLAALRQETGIDVPYSDAPALLLSFSEADDAVLEQRGGWQSAAGLPTERLTAGAVRELEPAVNPAVRWALRFPTDGAVDNRTLSRAVWTAAVRAGVEFRLGAEAAALACEGTSVRGVRLATGELVPAGKVALAGGCWSGALAGLPRPLPVEPLRGQIVAIESVPPVFRHVVDSPRCYTVPRPDGRLLVGSTLERAGYRKAVTARGVRGLIDAACELAPALADAPLAGTWSGLRPGTPDGRPILGGDPEVDGLFYATGHFKHGILLAPLTARLVADVVTGGDAAPLEWLSPGRFAAGAA